MTDARFSLTDADLDQALDAFLMGGPDGRGERVAEKAMLSVATTRQRGGVILAWFRPTAARSVLAAAAVFVVVLMGFGIWQAVNVAITPTPSPSPTSSPTITPEPSPTVAPPSTFSYPDDGYAISLPSTWTSSEGRAAGVRSFFGASGQARKLSIAIGSSDGAVTFCAMYAPCVTLTAASLDGLAAEAFPGPGGFPFIQGPTRMQLDGEPALEYAVWNLDLPGTRVHHVISMHLGRPVIVSYGPTPSAASTSIQRLLTGFQFLDPVAHTYQDLGFAIILPETWGDSAGVHGVAFVGHQAPLPVLEVVAATPDGMIHACRILAPTPACSDQQFSDGAEMASTLLPKGGGFLSPHATPFGSIRMGGSTEAIVYRTFSLDLAGVPDLYAFVVHDGRPYIFHLKTYPQSASEASWYEALTIFQGAVDDLTFLP